MTLHLARFAAMLAALAGGFFWLAPRATENGPVEVRFSERAEAAGCMNRHTMVQLADIFANIMPWLSSVGASAAAADFDNDGFADLYVTNSGRGIPNRLFRNRGDGTFEDVTDRAGVGCGNPHGAAMHSVWGDVDNDGRLDLYVVKWAEPNQLFRNNGDGTFSDISSESGTDYWGYGNGATFFDFDRDGRLDLVVGNYFSETVLDPKAGERVRNNLWNPVTTRVMHETFTHADNGGRNVLYRNVTDNGRIRFEEVSKLVGLTFTGWTLAVGSADLNNDGWPDLYMANDFGPDELYLNTGATENPPKFRLIVDPRGHPGVGNDWWKGMNVDMADVNNDGYLDIYVTNILEKRYKTDEGNMLWLNGPDAEMPGGRGFRNIAEESGTNDGGWGWGGKFADFNNDGLLDIYTVNGFATGDSDRNYWFAIQEMVTQTKNQTADAADWPEMSTRDLSGSERGRLFIQISDEATQRRSDGGKPRPEHSTAGGDVPRRAATGEFHDEKDPSSAGVKAIGHPSRALDQSRAREEAADSLARESHPAPTSSLMRESYLASTPENSGTLPRFAEVAEQSGITDVYNGRGIAVADFNHDGYLDMYVANQGAPSTYYVNETGLRGRDAARNLASPAVAGQGAYPPHPAFLHLKLVGRPDLPMQIGNRTFASTADAVGARVIIHTAAGIQVREVQGGMGFASQSEHAVHFGLPNASAIERIEIRWPSGRIEVLDGNQAARLLDRHWRIVEGEVSGNGSV